jgi:UTP--glucose-1-phosphate uridylyltransferase
MILDKVDAGTRTVLERFGFDPETFETLRAKVASGELSAASNAARGSVEPPREDDVVPLPEPGSDEWSNARSAGIELLRAGGVAQVVLAGGMATRFGGVVKGAVEAVDGRSFLSWKLGETARLAEALGTEIPVALMTIFQTED